MFAKKYIIPGLDTAKILLENAQSAKLADYKARCAALETAANAVTFCTSFSDESEPPGTELGPEEEEEDSVSATTLEPAIQEELSGLRNRKSGSNISSNSSGGGSVPSRSASSAARDELMAGAAATCDKEETHERILRDMVDLGLGVKRLALKTEEMLAADKKVLQEGTLLADENAASMTKAREQMREAIELHGGWTTWILIGVSVVVFLFMIFFIRLTSVLGL
eukprot:UC1_evm2s1143